jgi:hypothetical protein
MTSIPQSEKLSHHAYTRAFISLIVIIGVLVSSAMLLQWLKQIGWTGYNLSKAGLHDEYGNNAISAMAFDSQGQLWVRSQDAVSVLAKDGTWKDYPVSDIKIRNWKVAALVIDHDNRVWVGSKSGLELLTPQGKWKKISDEPIFALTIDQQGQLWVGTDDKLSLLSNGNWKNFTPENSELSKFGSKALFVDSQGQVWTTDGFQIDILKPDGSWKKNIPSNIPLFAMIQTLVIDKQNRLWVGTIDGLYVCNNGDCTKYNARNSGLGENLNSRNEVYHLAFDSENKLWISTLDNLRILDFDQSLPAVLLQWLLVFQWLENIILFILVYLFVIRRLPEKNNLLIGTLGGSLVPLIVGVSLGPLSFFTIVVTVIGAIIGLVAGVVGRKISNEITVYVIGGLGSIIVLFCIFLIFGAK